MDLSLETRHEDGRTIIEVGGEIDVYTAPKLRDKITELVGNGEYNLVIDMEKVDFLDSTGLGVHRRVPHGGSSRDNSREVATLLAVSTRLAQHGFWISRPTLWSGLLDVADTTGSAQVALVMLALMVWGISLRRSAAPSAAADGWLFSRPRARRGL